MATVNTIWEITSCLETSKELAEYLEEGWEPFAVITWEGAGIYIHLRRPKVLVTIQNRDPHA